MASIVPAAVALWALTACDVAEDMASITVPTSDASRAGAGDPTVGDSQMPLENMSGPPHAFTLTNQQRGYLDAIAASHAAPSSELAALSIGSYVCQARAARGNDQAVWDLVMPLVRSDITTADDGASPSKTEVDAATADYIRVATERLC